MITFVNISFQAYDLMPFSLTLNIFSTMFICFYCWFWTGKYQLGKLSKIESKIYMIFKLIHLVPLYRPLVFRVVLFSMFQFIGDTRLFSVPILQKYKRKKQFSRSDKFLFRYQINRHYFIKVISVTNFNFLPWLKLNILKGDINGDIKRDVKWGCKVYNGRVNKINQ